MILKPGVDARGVHPVMWTALDWLDRKHHEFTNKEATITSLRRPWREGIKSYHAPPLPPTHLDGPFLESRHWDEYMVTAADLRVWQLKAMGSLAPQEFCRYIQLVAGQRIGVVLEPDWLTPEQKLARERRGQITVAHIHVQLKRPITFDRWES